jgi:type III secretion system low calcium response chaperone LcrH/SycD
LSADPAPGTPKSISSLTDQIAAHVAAGATLGGILRLDERDFDLLYSVGHTHYKQRRFDDASKIFGVLLMLDHFERRYVVAFAATLRMTGDYESAIRYYTLATIMDAGDPQACLGICECLIALGRRHDAAEGLAMVLRQFDGPSHERVRDRARALLNLLAPPTPGKD